MSSSVLRHTAQSQALGLVRHWPTDDARRWVQGLLDQLQGNLNTLALVAVGSAIRNVPTPEDVDLVLFYRSRRPLVGRPPIDVDLQFFDAAAVESLIDAQHHYLLWALQFGLVLVERDRWWSDLQATWQQRLPLPSVAEARRREARARRLYADLRAAGDQDAADEQLLATLSHKGRALLLQHGIFPASRPELPDQLRGFGEAEIAAELGEALHLREQKKVAALQGTKHAS